MLLDFMNTEKQRIAIAEFAGWQFIPWGKKSMKMIAPAGYKSDAWRTSEPDNSITLPLDGRTIEESKVYWCGGLPDYLSDLNAIHEAEKLLDDITRKLYREKLCVVCLMSGGPIHAAASQRAETLLRTINKWTEEESQ